jgi:serine/threonine-protein kinase
MAVVYKATDLALGRCVALKLIAPGMAQDDVFRARFERECRLAAAIHHPHAVEIFSAGEEDGLLYVTMRYVEGTDLRRILEGGPLEPERAVGIVAQVAGALDEAHRHGLVHRDVKPGNILVARENGSEHAFLTDFGLSKTVAAAEEDLTRTGFAMGTADYMSPEQARGVEVDARADVYALGCVLFRSLTGSVVFERDSDVEKMWAHVQDPPPWLLDVRPDLPYALGEVVASALAKQASERPRSAGSFAREAVAALERGDEGGARDRAPGAPLRVIVADDSVLLRTGVAGVLSAAGFDVVAEAGDADELMRQVRAHRPDVAVVDIRMPPTQTDEGLRAARAIRQELPGTGVLVLSQYVEMTYAVELLGESAEGVGYLLKDRVADGDSLANAVRQVGQGGSALDPEVVARMLARRRPEGPLDKLSPREREVLGRMAEGQSNQAIAESLELSERVVERHVSSIFSKLELPAGAAGHRRVLAVLTYLRA